MVCCAFITLVLAGLLWPIRKFIALFNPPKISAMEWQLCAANTNNAPKFSISSRTQSVRYALDGLSFVLRSEHNARIHVGAAMFVGAIGLLLNINASDWLILILAIISVWFAETINTAFEYLCDVVSPEKNESVRKAKDIAAGAVLITALGAVVIGAIVLAPNMSEFYSNHQHASQNSQLPFYLVLCSSRSS